LVFLRGCGLPDRLIDYTGEPWAVKLRVQRNIGNFRRWKEHDTYQQAFDRALRDLKAGRRRRDDPSPGLS
jgi:hypothetical protein